ncbi:MAG: PAS domain-containing protein [Chitinophagales bacterium]
MKTEISGIYISADEIEHLKHLFEDGNHFTEHYDPAPQSERMEKALREMEDLYNNAPCGYHSLEPGGYFIRVNDTELEWLGETRESLLGQKMFAEMLSLESRKRFQSNFEVLKRSGHLENIEYELQPENGKRRTVLLNATAVHNRRGDFVMSRSVLSDISQRKLHEDRLKRINTFRDLLMNEVLAEVRSIRSSLPLMNETEKTVRVAQLCDHIERLGRMSSSV